MYCGPGWACEGDFEQEDKGGSDQAFDWGEIEEVQY